MLFPDKEFQELIEESNNRLVSDEKYRTGYEKFVNSIFIRLFF